MDYKFGTKNNWRRWQWNRIAERVRNKDGTVLYLATAQDYDRVIAYEKGLRNLIAVNKDDSICRRIRSRGNAAIGGELKAIVANWPEQMPIAAISADFCCGMGKDPVGLMAAIASSLACQNDVAVCVNMMRGRDSISNPLRAFMGCLGDWDRNQIKHRGVNLYTLWFVLGTLDNHDIKKAIQSEPNDGAKDEYIGSILSSIESNTRPALFTYKSTAGMMMDSICFVHPGFFSVASACSDDLRTRLFTGNDGKRFTKNCSAARRKIAAMKAMRTMAERGTHAFSTN